MIRLFQGNRLLFIAVATAILSLSGSSLAGFDQVGCGHFKGASSHCCHHGSGCTKSCPWLCNGSLAVKATTASREVDSHPATIPVLRVGLNTDMRLIKAPLRILPNAADPPHRLCFAEIVLQESLLTQAPPQC